MSAVRVRLSPPVIEKPGNTKSELVAHARALFFPKKYLFFGSKLKQKKDSHESLLISNLLKKWIFLSIL